MTTVMLRRGRSHAADRQARKAFEPTDEAADLAEPPGGCFAVEADRLCESAAACCSVEGPQAAARRRKASIHGSAYVAAHDLAHHAFVPDSDIGAITPPL